MDGKISQGDERALGELQASLLRHRPPALSPDQGEEAFQQHKLLAAAIHRASRLHQSASDSETKAWIRYIVDFFPEDCNEETDAVVLWDGWRCSLLKDDKPIVPITHGQAEAHWRRDDAGRPCLNLEDAWADYERSVDRFIEHLRDDADRRTSALARWRETEWSVKSLWAGATVMNLTASAGSSVAVIRPPEQ